MTTLQQRRATIPLHRRKAQWRQTLAGVVIGGAGVLLVKSLEVTPVWYLVALLFGLRIASRELLMDCLKIARDILTFQRNDPPSERGG